MCVYLSQGNLKPAGFGGSGVGSTTGLGAGFFCQGMDIGFLMEAGAFSIAALGAAALGAALGFAANGFHPPPEELSPSSTHMASS